MTTIAHRIRRAAAAASQFLNCFSGTFKIYNEAASGTNSYSKISGALVGSDYSGNVIAAFCWAPSASQDVGNRIIISKIIKGQVSWSKQLISNDPNSNWNGMELGVASIVCDKQDNIYLLNTLYPGYMVLSKIGPDGTVAWMRQLNTSGVFYGREMIIDSAGNIYIAGSFESYDIIVIKLNPTATAKIWEINLNGSAAGDTYTDTIVSLALSPAEDYLYAGGQVTNSSAGSYAILMKISTSAGTYTNQLFTGNIQSIIALYVDAALNVYGSAVGSSTTTYYFFKTDANFSKFSWWSSSIYAASIIPDKSGNLFLMSGSSAVKIRASDLTPVFKFTFTAPSSVGLSGTSGNGLSISKDGSLVYAGYGITSKRGYSAKLPSNGSRSGTYGDLTFSVVAPPAAFTVVTAGILSSTGPAMLKPTDSISFNTGVLSSASATTVLLPTMTPIPT